MGHGVSLQEAPADSVDAIKPSDDSHPRKEAFAAPDRPASAKSTKNAKSNGDGKRRQSKENIQVDRDKDKDTGSVLRARVVSVYKKYQQEQRLLKKFFSFQLRR